MPDSHRRGEYVQNILKILSQHPEGLQAKDVLAEMARRLPPNQMESEDFPNSPGIRRYEKYVRFTSIAPVKFGWIIKSKGLWTITAEGREIEKKFRDSSELGREVDRLWHEWQSTR